MTLAYFGSVLGYMTVCSFTPGPGNLLAMNTTQTYGFRRSRRLILGICAGYLCVQTLCALAVYGLSALLSQALSVLRYVGAAYMLYLAVHMLRSRPDGDLQGRDPTFRKGFLLQLVNVKIYFYMTTLLSVYLVPHIRTLGGVLLSGVGVVAYGSVACLAWAFLGVGLQKVYVRYYRWINLLLAAFLAECTWSILRA